jgi:hypothetical protein
MRSKFKKVEIENLDRKEIALDIISRIGLPRVAKDWAHSEDFVEGYNLALKRLEKLKKLILKSEYEI